MSNVLLAAGSICLLYFLLLVVRHVDFCGIWFLGAVVFGGWGGYLKYRILHPEGFVLPLPIRAIFIAAFAVVVISFGITEGKIIRAMSSGTDEKLDYLIVLGAQVKRTVPSKALRLRLETACEYLKEHPQTIGVLSGGQGSGEEITEAACMYQYLTDHGVPSGQLILENRSTTTRENLLYSARILSEKEGEQNLEEIFERKVGLVSNNFHIYRAEELAKKVGYRSVYGIAAPSDWKLQIHYMVREYFAVIKAKMRGDI